MKPGIFPSMSAWGSPPPPAFPGWSAGKEVSLGAVGLDGWKLVDAFHHHAPMRLLVDPMSHLQSGLSLTPRGPVPSFAYAKEMLEEVLRARPARLLVLGSGAGAIPISVARLSPETEVTAVDAERAMEHISRTMFSAPPSIKFVHEPALSFVATAPAEYDMVLVDVFSSDGLVPPELVSMEFASALRRCLSSSGRMVWNVSFRLSRPWTSAMSDMLATLAASSLPCVAYTSPVPRRAANALLYHPRPLCPPRSWRARSFSTLFRRPKPRPAMPPFRWPSSRL